MKNKIAVTFTAHNKRGNGGFTQTFTIASKKELLSAVKEFDDNCPFGRYEMETFAGHEDGKNLSNEETAWFEADPDIGF